MAGELQILLEDTGLTTLKARIINNQGTIVQNDLALAESLTATGFYFGDVSSGLSDGVYTVQFYTDVLPLVGSGELQWKDNKEVKITSLIQPIIN